MSAWAWVTLGKWPRRRVTSGRPAGRPAPQEARTIVANSALARFAALAAIGERLQCLPYLRLVRVELQGTLKRPLRRRGIAGTRRREPEEGVNAGIRREPFGRLTPLRDGLGAPSEADQDREPMHREAR